MAQLAMSAIDRALAQLAMTASQQSYGTARYDCHLVELCLPVNRAMTAIQQSYGTAIYVCQSVEL